MPTFSIGDKVQLKRIDKKIGTIIALTNHWNECNKNKLALIEFDNGKTKVTATNTLIKMLCQKN